MNKPKEDFEPDAVKRRYFLKLAKNPKLTALCNYAASRSLMLFIDIPFLTLNNMFVVDCATIV